MAKGTIADPNGLAQGDETVVTDLVFGTPTTNQVTITSVGSNIPTMVDDEYFEIRDHSDAVNNGLYRVNDATPATNSLDIEKVSGSNPIAAPTESASVFGSTDTAVSNMVFANAAAGDLVDITSATGLLPTLVVGSRFEVTNHTTNDGFYEVTIVNTVNDDYTCKGLNLTPANAATEAANTVSEKKNLFWDTAALDCYLLEQGGLDLDGVLGQAFYSKAVIDWKDDNFLIANAPFPMLTIDADAGKYLIGQDPSGNNSGWSPLDDTPFAIRTRKMFRNMGWSEIASDGSLSAQHAGIRTLGAFLDETAGTGDLAYYQFGNDTTVDDTIDFTFNGPVNEAILVYDGLATPADGVTGFAITTADTITRNDGGNWRTDGYKVGGKIEIIGAEDVANDGTYIIASVADAIDGALVVTGTLTNNAADTTASFAIDNRSLLTLRLRERTTPGNSNARTFSQSDLAAAGETILSNRLFTFGLSNAQDLDIAESDANIDANAPYLGMSVTYYATPQPLGDGPPPTGDGQLVGGPYNFGIVIDGNAGTNTEIYEWTQRQLRKATDIDADADTAIGLAMDGLMRFVGPTLQVGSTDGGLTFPRNPDGGGSGVYILDLNSASANDTTYFDNLGTLRQAPLSVAVTLDFNTTLIDDLVAEYALFFDWTRRRAPTDLVITAVSGANGTFTSTAQLSALDVGAGQYVRVSGLTGADEPMNGIYQVTAETSTSSWNVTRHDGETVTTTASATANIDEYPIDSPDAIIVQDNLSAPVTGLANADKSFSFDYSNNVQGGRTGGTNADVQARAIGQETAQYTQSTVQTISTVPVTIPVTSQIERNFLNP